MKIDGRRKLQIQDVLEIRLAYNLASPFFVTHRQNNKYKRKYINRWTWYKRIARKWNVHALTIHYYCTNRVYLNDTLEFIPRTSWYRKHPLTPYKGWNR